MDSNTSQHNNDNRPKIRKPLIFYYFLVLISMILLNALLFPALVERSVVETSYTHLMQQVDSGNIKQVQFTPDVIYYVITENSKDVICKTGRMANTEIEFELQGKLYDTGVEFSQSIPEQRSPLLSFLFSWILPIAFFVIIGNLISRKMSASFGGLSALGKSSAKVYVKDSTGVTFNDVAGEDEAKDLLSEIVDFLHHPDKYKKIGAKIPKGALLVGPPGTGKTLLAKAVAGEANVPFFSISGSEFVEMFVGMGAAKVRDLFKQASEKAPCIIFIDEIDAIGKKRGGGQFGGNDEREQTLNQLLTEMDGFDGSKGIVILAATNQPDSLDPALLRPGRFDRRVPVELPDLIGREQILKVHGSKVHMADTVDYSTIAKASPGASGAELANIINEAALRAVRSGREVVNQQDLEESIEVVMAGYQKKNQVLTEKEKWIVAYHETGHALVAALQTHSAPVHKITIIPRTSGALGYTMQVEDTGNHYLMSMVELENKIATLAGGRAAEEVVYNSITTGASNDIEQATKIARQMITQYGMCSEFDMVALETVSNQYLGGDSSLCCSSETQKIIDEKVIALVKSCHDKALRILKDNIDALHRITKYLYEKETISGEEFMQILEQTESENTAR